MSIETILDRDQLSLSERRDLYRKKKAPLDALIAEVDAIGGDVSFPSTLDIRLTGDKHKFLEFLRMLARHGFKTPKVAKGATGFSEFLKSEQFKDISFWVTFSSTVCRRVKIGTKTVEQDVYETVCDEIYPHGDVAVEATDDIPF